MYESIGVLHTDGNGLWSDRKATINLTDIKVRPIESDFGELRVYFDEASWNVYEEGLIYTDKLFLKELKQLLSTVDIDGSDVTYSEQGMQGDDYVSLDYDRNFAKSFIKKFPEEYNFELQESQKAFDELRELISLHVHILGE